MRPYEWRPLAKEDFPGQPWIEKLLRPINNALGQMRSGLGNGLTLGENLNAEIKEIDITTREEWVALSLTAPWTANAYAPAIRKVGRRVDLRGALTRNTGTSTSAAAAIPAGYTPAVAGPAFATATDQSHSAIVYLSGSDLHAAWSGSDPGVVYLDGVAWDAADAVANPAFPVRFKPSKVKGRIAGLVILRAVKLEQRKELPVYSAVSADWSQDADFLQLNGIAGLSPGATYRLRLLLVGG